MEITYGRAACLALAIVIGGAVPATAQDAATQAKTIAASFSKTKSVSKEKRGVRKEKYVRVHSAPAIKANPVEYSGIYEVSDFDMGLRLDLRVNRDGSLTGTGYDPVSENVRRTFTLRDGKVQDGLMTATKVYANGEHERFEAAFLNRTRSESPTDEGVTVFGLGTFTRPVSVSGQTVDKLFYEKVE